MGVGATCILSVPPRPGPKEDDNCQWNAGLQVWSARDSGVVGCSTAPTDTPSPTLCHTFCRALTRSSCGRLQQKRNVVRLRGGPGASRWRCARSRFGQDENFLRSTRMESWLCCCPFAGDDGGFAGEIGQQLDDGGDAVMQEQVSIVKPP